MVTQTWKGLSGDWNTATFWASGTVPGAADTAIFNGTSSDLAQVGQNGTESVAVGNVTLQDTTVTLEIDAGSTLAVAGSFALLAGSLELAGTLSGATLFGAGGSLEAANGTLSHDAIAGLVNAGGYFETLDVVGGLAFQPGATLELTGEDDTLAILDGETLAAGEILFANGFGNTLVAGTATPVTFASSFTLDVANTATLSGSFVNQGTIEVQNSDELFLNPANLTNTGVITLGSGADLELSSLSTTQLFSLAAGVVEGSGALIAVNGTLTNNAVLNDATGSLGSEFSFAGAKIVGGTIVTPTKPTAIDFGTLAGVTVQGPLDVVGQLNVVNGLTLEGAGGSGPGTLVLQDDTLNFLDSETLGNALITTTYSSNGIFAPGTGALTLASSVTAMIGAGSLTFKAGTVVNQGTIDVARGATAIFQVSGANFTNTGVINDAAGGIVEINGTFTTAELEAIVANIAGSGTVEIAGTILNGPGPALSLPHATIIDADVIGGTVINTGSLTVIGGSTLTGVTFEGPLNLGTTSGAVVINGGLALENLAGAAGGTINMGGSSQTLYLSDAEALTAGVLNVAGRSDAVQEATPTLTLGAGFAINDSGGLALVGTTIANTGTITVAPSSALSLATETLVNSGGVSVGAGSTLEIGFSSFGSATGQTLSVTGPGPIALASGATLALGAAETTAQVLSLLGPQTGVQVDLAGTLYNATNLTIASTGVLSNVQLDAFVLGGTVVNSGGTLTVGGGNIASTATLDAVTFDGPLNTGTATTAVVAIVGGVILQNAAGTGPGTINLLGPIQTLEILDAETLNGALVNLTGISDTVEGNGTLNLGNLLTVDVTGAASLEGTSLGGGTIANAGTVIVGPSANLDLDSLTIFNSGVINVAAGAELGVAVGVSGFSGTLTETGPIVLAAGATLAFGGDETTGQVIGLLNNQPGVALALDGTLVNTGATLATGTGVLTSVTLDGDIVGGTLVTSNDLAVIGGEFSTLTVRGPLTLTANYVDLQLAGSLTLQTAAGATGGTLALAGYDESLQVTDTSTLDHGTILLAGSFDELSGNSTLALGASLTLDATGIAELAATSINNLGFINVSGPGGRLAFDSNTINNSGIISVGSGDVIGIGVDDFGDSAFGTLSLTSVGVVHTGTNTSAFALQLVSGSTLALGGTATGAQLLALVGGVAGVAVDEVGAIVNTGTSLVTGTSANTIADLTLDGDIIGGTVANRGGTLLVAGGTFDGVTVDGALNLGSGADLFIVDGLHLLPAAGTAGLGTINASGFDDALVFGDAETLSNVIVNAATTELTITADTPTLTLGTSATFSVGSELLLSGSTIVNAGTIVATGSQALVAFESSTIFNSGAVTVGAGGVLGIDYGFSGLGGTLDFANVSGGSVSIANGGTLIVGSAESTPQLLALLGSIGTSGVKVVIEGTVYNTGQTLTLGSGLLSNVVLDADVVGGVIVNSGGSVDVSGGTLDGVTFEGPLNLTDPDVSLSLKDGFSLQSLGGGAGTLTAAGADTLQILDQTTLDGLVINVGSLGDDLTIDDTAGTLSLGSAVSLATQAIVTLEASSEIISGANVTASVGGFGFTSAIDYDSDTIINSGSISIGAGAELGLDPTGPLTAGATLDVNAGSVTLANGSNLAIGGAETTAQLVALVGSISHAGVRLVLDGSLSNAGASLMLAPGLFGNVLLNDTINSGTVVNAGGTIGYGDVDLQTVTFVGPLDVATESADITVAGSLTLLNSGNGAPGTLELTSGEDRLDFLGQQTLDNTVVLVSGSSDAIEQGTLTLGAGVTLTVTGGVTDTGTTLVNNGSIAVATRGTLVLSDSTVVNTGTITAAAQSVFGLSLASTTLASLPFFDTATGTVSLAAGATFLIGGAETDGQLDLLLGSLSNPGVIVELDGELLNTGSVFTTTAGGLLNDVLLDATVEGGTIATGTGSLTVLGGDLVGVTYQGTLVYGTRGLLEISNGITLENTAGTSPGAVLLTGAEAELDFVGSQTLAGASFAVTGSDDTVAFNTLSLAPSLAVTISGSGTFAGSTLVDNTPIVLSGATAVLEVDTSVFVNNAPISIGAGNRLDLENNDQGTIDLAGTGSFSFAAGSTLEIGGDETTAQLLALIGSLVGTQTGVVIDLDGEINNTGTSLVIAPTGLLSDVILDATVIGGTIQSVGGSLSVVGGEFESLVFQGLLALTGTNEYLGISGGLMLETASGASPGTLMTGGVYNNLSLDTIGTLGASTLETLSNVVIEGNGGTFQVHGPGPTTGTLVIASSVLSEATGQVAFTGGTVLNQGTLLATTPGAAIAVQSDSFVNTGDIVVDAGAGLALVSFDTLNVNNTGGLIQIASGGTLLLGGTLTTAQFEGLVGSLVSAPGVIVGNGVFGELFNQNTVLDIGPTGSLSDFLFAGAEVLGGTVVSAGTVAYSFENQFDDVTFVGSIQLTANEASAIFEGASTLLSGSAGQEFINATGSYDGIAFDPGGTLSDADVSLPPVTNQEIDNALIVVGLPGTASLDDSLSIGGGGTVTFGATTTVDLGTGADLSVGAGAGGNSTFVNNGVILSSGSFVSIYANTSNGEFSQYGIAAGLGVVVNAGLLSIAPGTAVSTAGTDLLSITGSFLNVGTIAASGPGILAVSSASFANEGGINLAAGATVDFQILPDAIGTITLEDGSEAVQFDGTGLFSPVVRGFDGSDVLDFTAIPAAGTLTPSFTFINGILDLFEGTTLAAAVVLPTFAYSQGDFSLGTDLLGGTEILTDIPAQVTAPPCFVAGTRIRTVDGEIAVEDLAPGTAVVTCAGTVRPVVWIGERRVACRRHPHPERVQPVRVRAGAFGPGLPMRDLLLSPDHSLFVDGVLIPVQHLLNGATIVREHVVSVHYYHVELSAHDVLYAEGLPAESYLDTGNRAAFANGPAEMMLHPDFAPLGWEDACAPLCTSGPCLERVRARLLALARAAGYRPAQAGAPALEVGGRRIGASVVRNGVHRYLLPANTPSVRIVSRTGVAEGREDHRSLGVAIAGIVVHGRSVDLGDASLVSGFWQVEHRDGVAWRWTDGCAELDLPVRAQAGVLELRVVEAMPVWDLVEPAERTASTAQV